MRISDWSSDVCSSDLLSEQLFQAAPGYVSSGKRPDELTSLLHPRTIDAITKTPDAELRFDYPAYAHQLRTWELLRNADTQSVLVSSGTGSGKTECFLVPLLDDLVLASDADGQTTGLRALILISPQALTPRQ